MRSFIRDYLGPALGREGLGTKLIIWDHNGDKRDYPISILNDSVARQYVNGSALPLYRGDITALSQVKNSHPDKAVYFTEQYTSSEGNFGDDLKWHLKNLVIGAARNWSQTVLERNLANDEQSGPHTEGGCKTCLGAITIGNTVTRNVSYYIIAHASKFVPPGSVRIGSNASEKLHNVAFITPRGKKVLIVLNEALETVAFNISCDGKIVNTSLGSGCVGTYIW